MQRIKAGDMVAVISGEDRGKRGKVMRVLRDKNSVIVEGVNQVKRHLRQTQQSPGGILEVEAPIHLSKVMPLDPETDKPSRLRFEDKDGRKSRVAKSGAELPTREE
jgi:large subunit ribosomal protein L24